MHIAGIRPTPAVLLVGFALGIALSVVSTAGTATAPDVPKFRVDPSWPKELPKNWIMGQVGGMAVDRHDHIWVLQRPGTDTVEELGAAQTPPRSMCCLAAPPVLEFDTQGNLLHSWGGPGEGFDWPKTEHGICVDKDDNVWIGANGPADRQILKFKHDGHFLMQIGHPSTDPPNSLRTDILGRPAGVEVDSEAHEVYVADGYMNKRVVVYVCDRVNDRMQVFTKQGKFVKQFTLRAQTLGMGSVWQFAFSMDENQKFLFVDDGENNVIWTVLRDDGTVVGQMGHSGRNAGQFHWVHQIVSDSQGNLYTGEVDTGKRIQKFILLH